MPSGRGCSFWLCSNRYSESSSDGLSASSAAAARYGGIAASRVIAGSLALAGALAGLAGALEVAGPLGRLTPSISPGYGFAAIVVAWLGRLHPIGCVVAAWLVAMIYLGGEVAQARLGLPVAIVGVFQGLLLLCLLVFDALVRYRLRWATRASGR